jgi:hypothetical protein
MYHPPAPQCDAEGAKQPRGGKLPSPHNIQIARAVANAEPGAARSRIVRERGTEQQSPFGIDTPERSPDCEASPGAATWMSRRPGAGVSSQNGDGEALSVAVKPDDVGCGMNGLHELFGPTFLKERWESVIFFKY